MCVRGTAGSPRLEAGQQQNQEVGVLAALAHQLVQDVGDDQESYQQAFGTRSICLPAVTCRSANPNLNLKLDLQNPSSQQWQMCLCFLCCKYSG